MVVGRLLSYWEGNFSGALLNFGGVTSYFFQLHIFNDIPKCIQRRSGIGLHGSISWMATKVDVWKPGNQTKTVDFVLMVQ